MLAPESQKQYAAVVRSFIWRWLGIFRINERMVVPVLLWGILVSLLYFITLSPPSNFPSGSLVKIKKGSTVAQVAETLKDKGVIRSLFFFEAAARLGGEHVIAGEYYFEKPQNVLSVAARLAQGDFQLKPVRVTIPEGANAFEVTKILSSLIADFDSDTFLKLAEPKEGYLFPDTYFFYPGTEAEDVIKAMENNFTRAITTISTTTVLSDRPLSDIVIMASLLEEEAPKSEDRRIIAGILWRRIEIDMPLQVDAVFPYIIGKNSFNLTKEDLRTDSPYNTYRYKGLPPGPISNPGLDAIEAAMTPLKSTYLYYLSDLEGNFHFCSTYTCHTQNKAKYLGT